MITSMANRRKLTSAVFWGIGIVLGVLHLIHLFSSK